ncbi:hypothetical protein EVAR_94428_1 [Eumeta japonica]|uniref:Uncharacterized protein n=1 Tax=Eumeta variegata TaxID=151549 RepID=A0A4C1TQ39_EUMVA|nr:hypothetical protein EVAR_94428_1 [Eumeta japonica]
MDTDTKKSSGQDLNVDAVSVSNDDPSAKLESTSAALQLHKPGLGLSRLGLRSPALISDLDTVPYSDSERVLGSNFNSTLDSNHGSILDSVLIRSRLSILLFVLSVISMPLPLTPRRPPRAPRALEAAADARHRLLMSRLKLDCTCLAFALNLIALQRAQAAGCVYFVASSVIRKWITLQ